MNDDRSNRVRELELRISQWERVHNHEMNQERDVQRKLRQTLSLSLRVVIVGSIPSVVWLLCWAGVRGADVPSLFQLMIACAALCIYSIVAFGAARGSGLVAHWWFCRSNFHERLATVVIALSADVLLFWWVIELARW